MVMSRRYTAVPGHYPSGLGLPTPFLVCTE